MNDQEICHAIVESLPYPVVFVDMEHIIRYMNRAARYHYCEERGHADLIGHSVFDCHANPTSANQIKAVVEKFRKDAKEVFLKVSDRNLRVYMTPVRSREGTLIGYYERFEMNVSAQYAAQQFARPNAGVLGAHEESTPSPGQRR